jgi:hypothetical protein
MLGLALIRLICKKKKKNRRKRRREKKIERDKEWFSP